MTAYRAAVGVNVQTIIADGFKGQAIKEELDKRRIKAVEMALAEGN
ncbi:hypothetical protein JCM19239_17 [Vibrio variabilis]|uniref:CCA tRNA nucleotidyltransferase n=2 Tax=Vibrio TaxID=662 RepID=A0ABQ0JDI1_9VIBR|nr:hypothetical protein JCM19239_17 [Vibrio variabilis]